MRVAVIGASKDRSKFGNKAVRAYLSKGYEVIPINPNEKEIEGLRCFGSVLSISKEVDIALFYVPPSIGLRILEEVAKKGIKRVYFNPDTESPKLEKRARELGLEPVIGCAIHAIGLMPKEFPS